MPVPKGYQMRSVSRQVARTGSMIDVGGEAGETGSAASAGTEDLDAIVAFVDPFASAATGDLVSRVR